MKTQTVQVGMLIALAALSAGAYDYKMSGGDPMNSSSFNSIGKWVDYGTGKTPATTAPAPEFSYYSDKMIRTPNSSSADWTFGGGSLTLGNQGYIGFKGKDGATITVDDLHVKTGGYIQNATDNTSFTLAGNLTLDDDGMDMQFVSVEPSWRGIVVKSNIRGSGRLMLMTPMSNETQKVNRTLRKFVQLEGDNSGFTGKIVAQGGGSFSVLNENSLGAAPETFVPDALTISGPDWEVTNDLTIASVNRGITLTNTKKPSAGWNQCSYPGTTFSVKNAAHHIRIYSPISGPGPIGKIGSGYLELYGSLANWSGDLDLGGGCTFFRTGAKVTIPHVTMHDAGFNPSTDLLEFGTFDLRGNNIYLDMENFDPAACATPRIVVTESLTITNRAVAIHVNTGLSSFKGLTQALIQAPGTTLSMAVAQGDLYLANPLIGALSVTDNGDGTETLQLRCYADSEVYYRTKQNDVIDTSSFTNPYWYLLGDPEKTPTAPTGSGVYYVKDNVTFRTPGLASQTFQGDQLILGSGRGLTLKGINKVATVSNLVVIANSSFWSSDGGRTILAGGLYLTPCTNEFSLQVSSTSSRRGVDLRSNVRGAGRLRLTGLGRPNPNYEYTVALQGDNSDFSGAVYVVGQTNFYCHILSEAQSLGRDPHVFTGTQLAFNGGGLLVTNNVVLDDPHRGITLEKAGGTCGVLQDDASIGCSYPTNTPAADRKFPGGTWFNARGTGVVLRVDCPIAGPSGATLTINAEKGGAVELNGAESSYAGGTVVQLGTLRALHENALGSGPLQIKAGGILSAPAGDDYPYGLRLKVKPTFEEGAALESEGVAAGTSGEHAFTLPLLLLPAGETYTEAELAALPVARRPQSGWIGTVSAEMVEVDGASRQLVSVRYEKLGFMFFIR